MSSTWSDPISLLNQYEALRREALETNTAGGRGHGLALFMSHGMTAWMTALSALVGRSTSGALVREAASTMAVPELPSSVRWDLTVLLADMVLACSQEAR